LLSIISSRQDESEEYLVFRDMRRGRQLLSTEDTVAVMRRCTNGVLACSGDEDYPYAVPLSYVYFNNIIYFHSAKAGHKIDAILRNPKVSFAVIDEDKIVSEEYTTYFRSVIAFGKARIVQGDEWLDAFAALVEKYSGDQPEDAKHIEITKCTRSYMIAIDVEHITGKEAIEYINAKR
jgi:nitroimidazol reductase NimA-like FMN-containing flavoprotein (pyridoxamine 5'-phosphate oxidase superfamily)